MAGKLESMEGLEFETVVEESGVPIDFETPGAIFIGEYLGAEEIKPTENDDDSFTQHKFHDKDGAVRVVNGGFKLNVGLEAITKGAIVRITRTQDVPMSDPGKNAMKDFRIEVAKSKGKAATDAAA